MSEQVVSIDSGAPNILRLIAGMKPTEPAFRPGPSSDGMRLIADSVAANDLVGFGSVSIIGHGSSSFPPAALRDVSWA
jgi:hypothetical protein